jgi:hypothetical protein
MQMLDVTALANLFREATKELGLKGVVMNACYSETQAEIIANAVGSVIAMEGPVSDNAAIQFTGSFYGCLGDGLSFERAYEWAIAETGLDETPGRLRPHLITSLVKFSIELTSSEERKLTTIIEPSHHPDLEDILHSHRRSVPC